MKQVPRSQGLVLAEAMGGLSEWASLHSGAPVSPQIQTHGSGSAGLKAHGSWLGPEQTDEAGGLVSKLASQQDGEWTCPEMTRERNQVCPSDWREEREGKHEAGAGTYWQTP